MASIGRILGFSSPKSTRFRASVSIAKHSFQQFIWNRTIGYPFGFVGPTRRFSSHKEIWGEGTLGTNDYTSFGSTIIKVTEEYMKRPNRFQKINEREDRSEMDVNMLKALYKGKYFIRHKEVPILKAPIDVVVFQQVLWDLRPSTVIELGTFLGGSALWLADTLHMMDINATHVYSMDIDPSLIHSQVMDSKPDNLTFLQGDSYCIEKTFTDEFLSTLPHPWLVIEDSHTNIYGLLEYFHPYMNMGDYFIVEDLNPDINANFGYNRIDPHSSYKRTGNKGLNVLKRFLSEYSQYYSVDSFYTDSFGYNGTWNWHGYIRKMTQ